MITRTNRKLFKFHFIINKQVLQNEKAKILFYNIDYKDKFGRVEKVYNFNIINGTIKDIIALFIENIEDIKVYNKANNMPGFTRSNTFAYNDIKVHEDYKIDLGNIRSKKDANFKKEYDKYLNEVKESLVFR